MTARLQSFSQKPRREGLLSACIKPEHEHHHRWSKRVQARSRGGRWSCTLPSLISLTVSVDVKHHVYLLTGFPQRVGQSFADPGEIKRREAELDPQESPGDISSREVELGFQKVVQPFASAVPRQLLCGQSLWLCSTQLLKQTRPPCLPSPVHNKPYVASVDIKQHEIIKKSVKRQLIPGKLCQEGGGVEFS